ncbi:hypothetical protein CsSME_00021139 [Camellia sinensis var. sinensis]
MLFLMVISLRRFTCVLSLAFTIPLDSQFVSTPRSPHWATLVRILRYLRSKKQTVVAHSTAKAEYHAMAHTTAEVV